MKTILRSLRRAAGQKSQPPSPAYPSHRGMDELRVVAEDTISRTPEIIASTPGASADSTFHAHQLPPLNKSDCPSFPPVTARIEPLDAFTTARKYIQRDSTIRGSIAVLNLASDNYRAGGWRRTLCKTQVRRINFTVVIPSERVQLSSIITGGGTLLLFHLVRHAQRGILPLAKPWTGFRRGDLLSGGRDLQRRSRSL